MDTPPTRRKKAKFLLLGCVSVVALSAAWEYYRGSRIDTRFSAVHVGASEPEVTGLLGKPSWIEPCGKSMGNPIPHCTEYVYRATFAPLLPAYYSVRLDNDGHVLATYLFVSP